MKTFKEFLAEQPKSIKNAPSDRWIKRAQRVWDTRKHKAKLIDPSSMLYQIGDDENGFFMSIYNDTVAYFVNYTSIKVRVTNQKFTRQCFIARNRDPRVRAPYTYDIPKKIFFDIIMNKFDGMISDTEQTEDGRRFWESAVSFALLYNDRYGVRVFNHLRKPAEYIDVNNHEEFAEIVDSLWGSTDVFRKITIAIYTK